MIEIKWATQRDVEKFKKELGASIKAHRKAKNLTQEQLAEIIGIDTSSLGCLEIGMHMPKPETLINISRALNVEIKFFDSIIEKDINKDVDEQIKTALGKIQRLESYGRRILKFCEAAREEIE